MRNHIFKAAALATALAALPLAGEAAEITGQATAFEGDTLEIRALRIRLYGIDAPGARQTCSDIEGEDWACGDAALTRLSALIAGNDVHCTPRARDDAGRLLADCQAGGIDLGTRLIAEGLAWASAGYSERHLEAEALARAQGLGVWRGDAQIAWTDRMQGWVAASGTLEPGACASLAEKASQKPLAERYPRPRPGSTETHSLYCDEAGPVIQQ
jgi:endonuclease YncB( thermonuclease family)